MTPEQTQKMADDAKKRLANHLNRMCAQQLRRMREQWAAKAGSAC
jgi:hypothetical protein